jgi:pimeloyl-ACP methyl ester carboxylesterase
MNDPIHHLPGIESTRLHTARFEAQVLTSGAADGEPVLFLHGNLSSSTCWEETMLALPARFHAVAPDQRGYGLSDRSARIDATRGVGDWADDAIALADHLGWDRFHVVAHSLGGCVAWRLIGDAPDRLRSVVLIAPGPPCGFGGACGKHGVLNHHDGAGSGGGLSHPVLVRKIQEGERDISDPLFSPRAAMNRLLWKPPFRPKREEDLLTAMLQVHLGDERFPGDSRPSSHWPGFAPGRYGPINAMAPCYNLDVLDRFLDAEPKPPLLWIYGADDGIISDASLSDPGCQGKLGLRPDWPGDQVFPPQPLLTQVEYALDQYERLGGAVRRLILSDTGHTPYLERPQEVQTALARNLQGA